LTSLQDSSQSAIKEQPKERKRLGNILRGLAVTGQAGVGLFILGVLYTIYFARSLLLPIFLALLFAALLQPLVRRLNRFRIPDSAGAAIVVLLFVTALVAAIYQLSTPAADWMNRGPILLQKADYKLSKLKESIKKAEEKTQQLEDIAKLTESKTKVTVKGSSLLEWIFTQTWLFLAATAVVLALIYFLLAQGRGTLLRLAHGMWGEEQGKRLTNLLVEMQQDIAAYLTTIALIYLVVGTLTVIAMTLCGMPTPVLWGGVAFLLHFIPFLGPVITFLILGAVSLVTFDTWLRILLPPLVYLLIAVLEGYFVTPMILGRRLTLNPIMVFGAILFWGWMWGIPGVFLAVPILTALKIICDNFDGLKPVGLMLGSDKAQKALSKT
jgi:predicted PurR-regulated permease PerM